MKNELLFLACAILAISACQKNDPAPEPAPSEGNLSCTMAIYGSSGSDKSNAVDIDYVNELIDAMWFGPTDKVKLIAQYNFDNNDPDLTYLCGTSVMRLLAKNDNIDFIKNSEIDYSKCKTVLDSNLVRSNVINDKLKEMVESGAYSFEQINGTDKVRLYLPSEIAKFLERAAEECPADHYYFCITGHGGGWDAIDDRDVTKAVAYDNNAPDSLGISAKNLTAGINGSGIATKIPVVYFNACQMNFLENICEYASCPVTYVMASFLYTNGTDNEIVMGQLAKAKGNEVSDLLDALLTAYKEIFSKKDCEISFIDIQKMKAAAAGVKDLVPLLKKDYEDDPEWYDGEIYNLMCPNGKPGGCDKDFSQFLSDLSEEKNIEPAIKNAASSILSNIRNSIVQTIYGGKCAVHKNILTGVKFIGKTKYAESRKDYAASYDVNAFYSLTGWNTLFELFDDDIND